MKSFTSFTSFLSLVFFCFATTVSTAQVNANAGFHTTDNPYTYSATAGSGSTAVVALIKPTTNKIRVSSYFVSTTGVVTWKDNHDFSSATIVKVAMLTDNLVVVARRVDTKLYLTTFDINATTGVLTKKHNYEGLNLNTPILDIVKLSNNSFATLVGESGGARVSTFTVDANGMITIKSNLLFIGHGGKFELARLSDNRFLAFMQVNEVILKIACLDVAANTYAIAQSGSYTWHKSLKKLSLTDMSSSRFAAFMIDAGDRLDAMSFYVSAGGGISLVHSLLDIKKPGTNDAVLLRDMEAQTIGAAPGKILIGGARTDENLCVLPVSFTNGILAAPSYGYFPNAPNVTQASVGLINGNMLIGAFRQVEDGKYHIRSYKWD